MTLVYKNPKKPEMPKLFKLLLTGLLQGAVLGWSVLAVLLVFNFFGMKDMVFGSSDKYLALFLLAFGFLVTFGSITMGLAVMLMPYDDDDEPKGGHKMPVSTSVSPAVKMPVFIKPK